MASDGVSSAAFRRLLTRSVAAPSVLLAVLAVVFLGQILYLLSAAQWVDHTDLVIAKANFFFKLLVDGETGIRGYFITGDSAYLEPYHLAEGNIGTAFAELLDLVADNPSQLERLKTLRARYADWQDHARMKIDLRKKGGDYSTPVRNREGKRQMDAMRGQIAAFIRVEEELRDARTQTVQLATWGVIGLSLGLTLLIGGVLALFTRRQLLGISTTYRNALAKAEAQAESLSRSAHRLETLHEIDRAILAADSVLDLTHSALHRMKRIVPSDESLVIWLDAGAGLEQVLSHSDREVLLESDEAIRALAAAGLPELSDRDKAYTVADLALVAGRTPLQERLQQLGYRSYMAVPLRGDGKLLGGLVLAAVQPATFTAEHQHVTEEIARQISIAIQQSRLREALQRNADELEQRVLERTRELREALANVQQLQGLLPICAWCKKVRDDNDYWHEVGHYIAEHTEATITHGICPECLHKNLLALEGGPAGT